MICSLRSKRFIDLTEDDPVKTLERLADKFEDEGQTVAAEKTDSLIEHLESEREFDKEHRL
jgi:hypothetical protein